MKKKNIGLAIVLLAMLGLVAQAGNVTTAVISAADTGIRDAAGTYGSDTYMYVHGSNGGNSAMAYVRFDLSGICIDTIVSASLTMTLSGGAPRNDTVTTGRYAPHGLNNTAGNTPQNWNEATLNRNGTGLEVNWTAGTLDMARVTDLDSDAISGVPGTNGITETLDPGGTGSPLNGDSSRLTTFTTEGEPLLTFLNSRIEDDSLVTFIINIESDMDRGYGLISKEEVTDLTYRPTLTLTYTPGGAYNPFPLDGSTVDVAFRDPLGSLRKMSWTPAEGTTKWDMWFGTGDPNSENYTTVLTKVQSYSSKKYYTIPAGVLTSGQVYSWVVDSYKGTDPNILRGVIWQFTATSMPVVTVQPVSQAKFAGETAVFTVGAQSSVDIASFRWYKSSDNANNTPTDDVELFGDVEVLNPNPPPPAAFATSTSTLTLVAPIDEKYYYCIATNSVGSTPSNTAHFVIKRLYAHWALDGNLNDSSGNNLPGTLFGGEPNFVPGIVNPPTGQALGFDGVDDYIAEPNTPGSFGFSDFSAGMTISVWAKPTTVANYARFIDFGTGGPGDNIYLARAATTNDLQLGVIIGTGGAATPAATNVIVLNEWQMFVATVDGSGNAVLYKNGLSAGTGTIPQMPAIITRTRNYIGRSNWTADAMYKGSMDDIYIYNYAISDTDVANMYSAVRGNFCRYPQTYDWDNNCKVDIGDIGIFAEAWLECGFYPACP